MKKLFAFIFITIVLMLAYHPAVRAEHILSLVHSGVQYTTAQAAAPDSGYSYIVKDKEDATYITDEASGIRAEIINQSLDDTTFKLLRNYYNDNTLSNEELFSRFTELKKSYITALETLYNTNYLSDDKNAPQTAMRIYYEGNDKLFGLDDCSVYLYNITRYEGLNNNEQAHLDLIIPVHSTSSVIIIKFTIPRDKLGTAASGRIAAMLSDIRFSGLSPQSEAPAVLNDNSIIQTAQLGIYPAASLEQPDYTLFEDTTTGFSLSLPAAYAPFIQNNLGGVFTYTSFRINPNQIFSVSSEPLQGSGAADAISRFKEVSPDSIKVMDTGNNYFGSNQYSYFIYSNTEDEVEQYFYDYYIQDESRLYKLQLQCAIAEPGAIVKEQFEKILMSFISTNATSIDSSSIKASSRTTQSGISAAAKYLNSEEGYSFKYPDNWLLEDVSPDIAYDQLQLIVPGLSGALEISVQESGLKQTFTFADLMKSVNDKSVSSWPALTMNYNPPFAGKTSKLLYSGYSIDGAVSTIYRLSVFMDDNGRNRLCYSVDILKGHKLYSMFITAGEYITNAGRFSETRINDLINAVAASFRSESTQESEIRRSSGETRNRKLVFVENNLRQLIDPGLVITSIGKTQPDGTFLVTVSNTAENGYYRIKLDYPNRKLDVADHVLKRSILQSELARLKEQYNGRIITKMFQSEGSMTITIESRENPAAALVTRYYHVNVPLDGSSITWQSVRLAGQEDYLLECGQYVKTIIQPDARVYFSDSCVFNDLEIYRQKGLMYRLMTYVHSKKVSGFLILSMDPRSSLFTAEGGIIPLEQVVNDVAAKFGINYLSYSAGAYSFDPENFILSLLVPDGQGSGTSIEQFKIFYDLENSMIEYKRAQ